MINVLQETMGIFLVVVCWLACIAASTTALTLKPGTGMIVMANNAKAPPGSRYKGSGGFDTDPAKRDKIQGKYQKLATESQVIAIHLLHVPNTDKYLYLERTSARRSGPTVNLLGGTLDLATMKWNFVQTDDLPFCSGHSVSSEGEVVVVGGHVYVKGELQAGSLPEGMRSVRSFNVKKNPNAIPTMSAKLARKRWYPTATLLSDGLIMIMGGREQAAGSSPGNPDYELYNPATNKLGPLTAVEPGFAKRHAKKMLYPFNFLLPSGDVYVFGNRRGRIFSPQTGVFRKNSKGSFNMPEPPMPGREETEYPYTASATYGVLTWENGYSQVDLMIFGGTLGTGTKVKAGVAGSQVRRITIKWSPAGPNGPHTYSFSDWSLEDLGIPRVMPDTTMLPNGDILICNGAQVGEATDQGGADFPALWAQLYQPDLPKGKRVTTLVASPIARMYHSTAALTTEGTILISGSDNSLNLQSDVAAYPRLGNKYEYRNEIFYTPYYFDTANKPVIASVSQSTLGYGQSVTVTWSGSVPITSVSLVAPSSSSHSFNQNQRVIVLKPIAVDYAKKTITLLSPPTPFVAPPQYYMLFAMNRKTMGKAKWVKLVDTKRAGKVSGAAVPK